MVQNLTRNPLVMSDFSQPSYWPTNERLKILDFLLFDLKTSGRGQNGVEFYQEATRHVRFFLALLLAEIANERLKILIFLLFDLKTSGRGQNGVEFNQESTGHALLLANERLIFGSCKEPSKSLCPFVCVCLSVCLSSNLNYGSLWLSIPL